MGNIISKYIVYKLNFGSKIVLSPEEDKELSSLIDRHEVKIVSVGNLANEWNFDDEFSGKIPKLRGFGGFAEWRLTLIGLSKEKLTLHFLKRDVDNPEAFASRLRGEVIRRAIEWIKENNLESFPIVIRFPCLKLWRETERFYIFEVFDTREVTVRVGKSLYTE